MTQTNHKIILFTLVLLVYLETTNIYAQQIGGGIICDDENISECLDNAPEISIDGVSLTEFIPFILPIIIVIILISLIIILKYRKNNPSQTHT